MTKVRGFCFSSSHHSTSPRLAWGGPQVLFMPLKKRRLRPRPLHSCRGDDGCVGVAADHVTVRSAGRDHWEDFLIDVDGRVDETRSVAAQCVGQGRLRFDARAEVDGLNAKPLGDTYKIHRLTVIRRKE